MPLDLLGRIGSSGVRGLFRAEVTVSETGSVTAVQVTHSLGEAVDAEILPALRQLLFNPATLNGKPVAAIYDARFNFTSN
jgi:TonB family protein